MVAQEVRNSCTQIQGAVLDCTKRTGNIAGYHATNAAKYICGAATIATALFVLYEGINGFSYEPSLKDFDYNQANYLAASKADSISEEMCGVYVIATAILAMATHGFHQANRSFAQALRVRPIAVPRQA